MEFHVNENCIGCGLCASVCPDVFQMNLEGVAQAAEGDVGAAEAAALEAMESCPVEAIEKV